MNSKGENKFLVLLNNEISRSVKFMIPGFILFFIAHILIAVRGINYFNKDVKEFIREGKSLSGYVSANGRISINKVFENDLILFLICFGVALILVYAIAIWLREWYGNNKTIYTLLVLPISKHKIILSKFCAIFLLGTTFIATQIATLFVDNIMFKAFLNKEVIQKSNPIKAFLNGSRMRIFPKNLIEMSIYILIIIAIVMFIFNGVLIERSFKFKGIILDIILCAVIIAVYIMPRTKMHFFLDEYLLYIILISIIIVLFNYFSAYYLLRKKINI
ncbi:hypothetical protein ACOAKC_07780 [Hathewaya histolytica]|uniref:hypothetical protein n=1 Tax=Hathewaya histolytica TaxID=1498 RepID=UPI003B67F164